MSIYAIENYIHPTIAERSINNRPMRQWEREATTDVYRCIVSLGFFNWYQLNVDTFDLSDTTSAILNVFFGQAIGFYNAKGQQVTVKKFIHCNFYINRRIMATVVKMLDRELDSI